MSSFNCEKCDTAIVDTSEGYISECEHYPLEASNNKIRVPNKVRKCLSGLKELFLEKSCIPSKSMACLCFPQPCPKDHQKEVDEAWHKEHGTTPCLKCGGIIETHQGNNGFPDEWYCLSCGKEFGENPFKLSKWLDESATRLSVLTDLQTLIKALLKEEQERVMRIVIKEYEYHQTLSPDAFNALVKAKLRNE